MLRSVKDLRGYKVAALDGEVGRVTDVYFDDQSWTVQYMVVDTGGWLPGRKVLLPYGLLGHPDWGTHTFPVDVTRKQVEESPPISADEPVSRQHEIALHRYLRIDPYWARVPGGTFRIPEPEEARQQAEEKKRSANPHLRSTREVIGYGIQTKDGQIGHVEDFIADDETWTVRYIVVDTRRFLPGKKVLVAPAWIDEVSWSESKVRVDLEKDRVKNAPEYNPAMPVNKTYEARLYDYYGRPHYW